MQDFTHHRPAVVAAAATVLEKAEDGQYLAGGQTLIPVMKQGLAMPSDLVDLGGIGTLRGVRESDGGLLIGAMATHAEVAADASVKAKIPVLAALAGAIGDPHVRNRGTIGGSLANNDPAADYPAAVLALNATVHTDKREIAADDFFVGLFETALDDGELITGVEFPAPQSATYEKFTNQASRFAIVGVMVARGSDGVRVAVTGAGPGVFRVGEMESALGTDFTPAALEGIEIAADDLNTDLHASAEYRAHLIGVLARRAVARAT